MDRSRNGRTTKSRYGEGIRNSLAKQRAVCIGCDSADSDLSELRELLRTSGVAVCGELVQRRVQPDPDRYFGRGKLASLRELIAQTGANLVACDDELLPRQERNLETAVGVPVIDRTAIILDIFASHAHSREGKLQVELAQLEYNLSRMRGLWTHLERLGGGIGTRGPGESQIETDRRLARDRVVALRRRLAHTAANRSVMRQERERAKLSSIALTGYTNAGKSTLLNTLTGAGAGVRERLFHTLDPTTRTFEVRGRSYLITDTVGFIRKLPHQLVESFAATLEEAMQADLLVHVADASSSEHELSEMLSAVEAVLSDIDASDRAQLLVLNKIDLVDEKRRRELSFRYPRAIQVSGATGEGTTQLCEAIDRWFVSRLRLMRLLVPYDEGKRLSELHDLAGEVRREDTFQGVRVDARVPAELAGRFERFSIEGIGQNGHESE